MQKIQTVCLLVLTTIAVGVSLALLKTVLLPFVVAVFIVIGCRPVLSFFEVRLNLNRYIAYAATFVLGCLGFLAFGAIVWASFADLANNAGAYEQRLDAIAAWILERMPEDPSDEQGAEGPADSRASDAALPNQAPPATTSASDSVSSQNAEESDLPAVEDSIVPTSESADAVPRSPVGLAESSDETIENSSESAEPSPGEPASHLASGLQGQDVDAAMVGEDVGAKLGMSLRVPNPEQLKLDSVPSLTDSPAQAMQRFLRMGADFMQSQLLNLASALSVLLSNGILILIFSFFLLLGSSEANSAEGNRTHDASIVYEVEQQVRKYLVMKTVISLLTGLAFGLVLWFFGVPLAILFGFSAFLLNFIPNIGPLVSSVLPIPFLILNSTISPVAGMVCFLLCALVQFVSGNIIEPKLMGESFDVSPTFLLVALMFFGLIWGIVGMFLATPIVSVLKIVLERTTMGRPVAELMAGRWEVRDQDSPVQTG